MKSHHRICKVLLTLFCFLFMNVDAMAQIEVGVEAIPPADQNSQWEINVAFVPVPTPEKIKQVFL